jgi:long-chain acyl-CoA synthetase
VPRVLDLLRSYLSSRDPHLTSQIAFAQRHSIGWRLWHFRAVHRLLGWKFWAFVCGGAKLPLDLEHFWNSLGYAVVQGYGMTETAALITLNHPFKISEGTIGKALPGRELSIGADGEISVRGEMVATATWQSGGIQQRSDSWLATGDLVAADDEGNLRFLGRKSETIVNPAGLNIHPEDVEAALLEQPEISACAVVPVALPSGGEEPAAVLVAPAGLRGAKAAVIAANHSLAEFQRIRRWYLWPGPSLPRTSTGKVQRRKVAEWVARQTASPSDIAGTPNGTGNGQAASISFVPVSSPDSGPDSNQNSNHDQLIALITSLNPTTLSRTDDETRLAEDLQLDSLGRVQLQNAIEQSFGVLLDDDSYMAIETLGQLRKAIAGSAGLPASQLPMPAQIAAEDLHQPELGPAAPPQPLSSRQPSSNFTYPRWPSWKPVAAIRIPFLEAIVRPLVWLLLNPRLRAANTSPDALPDPSPCSNSPMLLIANHVEIFDVPLILYALPGYIRRHVAVAAAGEMLEDWKHARNQGSWWQNAFAPIMYLLLTALFHVFPLPRQAGFRRSFTHIGELLDRGYHVLIFPEGRRSLDGTLQPFRSGIGLLAQESSAPVLPVALKGMPELIARQRRWFHAGLVEIRTGSPIPIRAASSPDEIARSLHDDLAKLLL